MKNLKNLFAILTLTLLLSACSEDNANKVFKIDGVFGLKLAAQGPGLTEGYLEDNKPFDFTPSSVHKSFNSYTFSVTPNTHKIYGIKITGPKELPSASCKEQRNEIIKETLAKLGDTSTLRIHENGNEWKITEGNNRSIIINCERTLTPTSRQLVMTYRDASLSKLSFVEWDQHQDDITK
ncbi:MAG: hypothetical protein COB89_05365 [Piscirickettsiaceae bacterium]|nr:MAG: hypothetical protein COB89_05365 [Piscirickettsiaceae bacterium]